LPRDSKSRASVKQARWDEILQAAGMLFFEKGFVGTTMQDIADRVGLLAGSLYYYIDTKEDLLYELAKRVSKESLEYLNEEPSIAAADATTRLCSFIELWMRRVNDAQPRAMYAAVEWHRGSLSPDRLDEVSIDRQQLRAFLAEIVEQGISEGTFAPAPARVAATNITQLLWLTAFWFDPNGPRSFDQITAWYKIFILRGLGASPKRLRELGCDDAGWMTVAELEANLR
jgi:AcrR family transcriptional regulator